MLFVIQLVVFALFLALYLGFFLCSNRLMKRVSADVMINKSFWSSEALNLLFNGAVLVFIYLLSGFFSLEVTVLFLVTSQIGVLISAVLWGLLGSSTSQWGPRSIWAGWEFAKKHTWLSILASLITPAIGVIVYPIISGIAYFTLAPPELTIRIFQYTLVALIFISYPISIAAGFWTLSSENLDEETRTMLFVNQIGGLVTTAVYLAIAFWAFGFDTMGTTFLVGGISITLSPTLLIFLVFYFGLTLLIPYFVGIQRAKKWRLMLLQEQKRWYEKILTVLDFPNSALYATKLATLKDGLGRRMNELRGNQTIKWGVSVDQEPAKKDSTSQSQSSSSSITRLVEMDEQVREAYLKSRNLDPRFQFLDWLREFIERAEETIDDLSHRGTDAKKEKGAEAWARGYREEIARLDNQIKQVKGSRVAILIGLAAIATPILSAILGQFGNWLWSIILGSSGV